MVADDVYRSRLQATIAGLRYWVPTIADAARIEQTEEHDFWKLSVTPAVAAACPFELMLRSDQHYDIVVAGEMFEDQSVTSLELFLPLVDAIAAGRVIQRRTESVATGASLAVETRVALADGSLWSRRRSLPGGDLIATDDAAIHDRHFLPYRR